MRTTPTPEEVHVYYRATDAMEEADVEAASAILSEDEQARCRRFVFARDRRDYAAAHALLRMSLSRYTDLPPTAWTFREEPGGKPALAATDPDVPRLSFNLSHTHGLVACAIASGADVGIDVESVERDVDDGVAQRFFSARETAELRSCASDALRARRFFDLWTLKESYLKAIGTGLVHPLRTVVFTFDEDNRIGFVPPSGVDPATWHFRLFMPTRRHRLAVAVRTAPEARPAVLLLEAG